MLELCKKKKKLFRPLKERKSKQVEVMQGKNNLMGQNKNRRREQDDMKLPWCSGKECGFACCGVKKPHFPALTRATLSAAEVDSVI